jgi:hypothetical protein
LAASMAAGAVSNVRANIRVSGASLLNYTVRFSDE